MRRGREMSDCTDGWCGAIASLRYVFVLLKRQRGTLSPTATLRHMHPLCCRCIVSTILPPFALEMSTWVVRHGMWLWAIWHNLPQCCIGLISIGFFFRFKWGRSFNLQVKECSSWVELGWFNLNFLNYLTNCF